MNIIKTKLDGTIIIEPKVFGDNRGFFMETYHCNRYKEVGIDITFVQDNHSRSSKGY
jgi:dTDP-4-dehydrorhamnose 3,5-epimerase